MSSYLDHPSENQNVNYMRYNVSTALLMPAKIFSLGIFHVVKTLSRKKSIFLKSFT